MRRSFAAAVVVLVTVLLLAQLVPVARSNPPVVAPITAPPEVMTVLDRACADCHSHETRWPWYSRVAPVSWLVVRDVDEGREKLNLSTWGALEPKRQQKLREEMWEEVSEGEMPLRMYRLAHPEARLSEADRELLRRWAGEDRRRRDR